MPSVDQPEYFPSLGVWAKPGDDVVGDDDGVRTVKVNGAPYDPNAEAVEPEAVVAPEPEPVAEPTPDAPEES